MRVALVHRYFWRMGAVPAVAREWASHLAAGGHQVVVFASDVDSGQDTARQSYVALGLGPTKRFDLQGFVFAARLLRALWRRRRHRPDVMLVVDSTAYFGAWAAGKLLGVPAIMAFQGWIYSPGKRGLYPPSMDCIYRLSVHFCVRFAPLMGCLSREVYDGLRARGAPPERLWLAPNCVDLGLWETPKEGAHARAERTVLYVGRFSPEKGLRFLLEAAPAVVARCPGVRFRLVGADEPEDGEYHELARRLGVLERVEFGGTVAREALAAIYADADVLAVPSLAEGHALAPMESLASGTPVVGSNIPGIRGTVEDGVNGLLVPSGDPATLAEALCRVLEDAELRDRLRRAAKPSVRRFSWEARIAEFPELVRGLRERERRHG